MPLAHASTESTSPSSQLEQSRPVLDGKYRLLRLIGNGRTGVVYEAEGLRSQQRVAVKIVHPELAKDPVRREGFLTQARAAAGLAHPNLASMRDVGIGEAAECYVVSELLSGFTLEQFSTQRGPLPEQTACELILQVLSALSEAHAAGLVHGNLKPSDVFIEESEPDLKAKVTGFGLAPLALPLSTGEPGVGSDLYAAAAMLYELLSAKPSARADAQANLRPDIPRELAEAVHAALSVRTEDRPADVEAFAERLRPFVSPKSATIALTRTTDPVEPIPVSSSFRPHVAVAHDPRTLSDSLLVHPRIPRAESPKQLAVEYGLGSLAPLRAPSLYKAERPTDRAWKKNQIRLISFAVGISIAIGIVMAQLVGAF